MPVLTAHDPAQWLSAIFSRRSRRAYDGAPTTEQLSRLKEVAADFQPFDDARTVVIEDIPPALFTGIVGSYGRVKGAATALAFVADPSSPHADEHCGYTGEGVVLEAHAMGLATCWIGGLFSRQQSRSLVELRDGEVIRALSPVGPPSSQATEAEKLVYGHGRPKFRRPLEEIARGHSRWPEWAVWGVEAAQLAPSAMNLQPWRFRYENGSVVVTTAPGLTGFRRLDCGIAMLHFELGARAAGADGAWEPLEAPDVARWVPLD